MKEAIIIGWVNHKHPAVCGETMKNQLMINKLEENGIKCLVMDELETTHYSLGHRRKSWR